MSIAKLEKLLMRAKRARARSILRVLQGGHEMSTGADNLRMHNAFRTLGVSDFFRPRNINELKELRPNFCAPIVKRR